MTLPWTREKQIVGKEFERLAGKSKGGTAQLAHRRSSNSSNSNTYTSRGKVQRPLQNIPPDAAPRTPTTRLAILQRRCHPPHSALPFPTCPGDLLGGDALGVQGKEDPLVMTLRLPWTPKFSLLKARSWPRLMCLWWWAGVSGMCLPRLHGQNCSAHTTLLLFVAGLPKMIQQQAHRHPSNPMTPSQ